MIHFLVGLLLVIIIIAVLMRWPIILAWLVVVAWTGASLLIGAPLGWGAENSLFGALVLLAFAISVAAILIRFTKRASTSSQPRRGQP
jgi:hypothetical protein